MQEIWIPIKDYENYEISNFGNVRKTHSQKILKPMLNEFGYQHVELWKFGKRKRVKIHRLVAIAFLNNPDNLKEVNHIDGNKTNNNTSNLEWCTRSENIKHSYRMGLTKGRLILSPSEIEFVKSHYKKHDKEFNACKLAAVFGVAPWVIYNTVGQKKVVKT